jgi:hypothetical protein
MRLFTWHRYLLLAWDSVHCFKFLTSLLGWSVDVCDLLPPIEAGFVARLGHHKTTTLVSPCHFLVQKYFGVFSDHFNLKFLIILRSI